MNYSYEVFVGVIIVCVGLYIIFRNNRRPASPQKTVDPASLELKRRIQLAAAHGKLIRVSAMILGESVVSTFKVQSNWDTGATIIAVGSPLVQGTAVEISYNPVSAAIGIRNFVFREHHGDTFTLIGEDIEIAREKNTKNDKFVLVF